MKPIKAFFLTSWIYVTLIWLFIVVRIIVNEIDLWDTITIGIPVTLWVLGIAAFLISAACCFAYLVQT